MSKNAKPGGAGFKGIVSLSARMRKKRLEKFLQTFSVTPDITILDVGGTSQTWIGTGLERQVTLLNLTTPKPRDIEMGFNAVQGNALTMHMFEDNRFDIVFSNSVIEHVGSFENQKKFAHEIKRVGRSFWVQTPNRHFPLEPHFLFPMFQFLPNSAQKKIAVIWPYSHFKRWNLGRERILKELNDIRLLSLQELKKLFPKAQVYEEKTLVLTKSLTAWYTG